jgi:hypothetical protein
MSALVAPTAASAHPRTAIEFFARVGRVQISCAIYDGYAGGHEALCEQLGSRRVAIARLTPEGTVLTCESRHPSTSTCEVGNAGERTPTFRRGHRVSVGRFSCAVLRTGVRCVVAATGKGFLFGPHGAAAVGGATIRPAPLRLESFLSPDRKVWCSISTGPSPSANCGTEPAPPTHSAQVDRSGRVTLCSVLKLEYPAGSHAPNGCYQNWDPQLPVLAVGQEDELGGFRCASAANGITCTVIAGAGAGKGFRVSAAEAVEVT